jgi:lipoprotein NlpI
VVDFHKPVELTATGTRTGWFASELRAGWQMQGRDAFEKGGQEFLRRYYPTAERAGPISIEDDVSSDRLVSTAEFRLPEYFTHKIGKLQGTVVATNVLGVLVEHPAVKLNYPLPLKYPMNLSQDIIVEFPEDVPLASEVTYSLGNDFRTFRVSRHYENKELHVRYEIRTLKPEIPAEAVKQDNELIRRIRAELRYDYEFPVLGLNNETNLEKGISHAAQQMHKADEKEFGELTAAIRSGRLSGSELAKVYVQRAWSLERLDRYAEALADAKMAETIDPNSSDAVETQAADLDMLQRFDEAEKLYAIVEPKFSDNAEFFLLRGSMYYRQGSYAKSIVDLRHVIQIAKTDEMRLKGLIWLLLATQRSNEDTQDVVALAENSAGLSDAWPGPVLKTLLGRMSPADLYLRSQNGPDESASLSQICEAYYFVGQHLLIMGDVDEAKQAFEKAVRTDSHRDVEYVYSLWELQRLGSGK